MKLVLTNFGQDISLVGDVETVYLVFTDEESGRVFRLPSNPETVGRLAAIHAGDYTGEPAEEQQEEQEEAAPEEPEQEEQEEEPEPPPVPQMPRPTLRKRITQPAPSPTRSVLDRVRGRLEDHQDEDDGVPSL